MRTSYKENDVILLLKDISGMIEAQGTEEREKLIQSGKHYSEMLPIEYVPTQKYMEVYQESLKEFSKPVANAVACLCKKILERRGDDIVLVSLARAGIPVGILIKRFFMWKYKIDVPHFSISIIRGRGIDKNAMNFLLSKYDASKILFVDGWVGKGAILDELKKDLKDYPDVSPQLAVIADPANVTDLCGTHDDILIPSSCLNSTVSGLISRTVLRSDLIGEKDFHGAVFYENLLENDLSYSFIEKIQNDFPHEIIDDKKTFDGNGKTEVEKIAHEFGIADINLIKPGIGEATRVLLRRLPWKILIDPEHFNSSQLKHLKRLAEEKNVPILQYKMTHYKCCGIIKNLADT